MRPNRAVSGDVTGSRLREITLDGGKVDGRLSRDGSRLLQASVAKLSVHNFRTGESRVLFTLPVKDGFIGSFGWSPDERRVSFDLWRFARNTVAAVLEIATGKQRIWLESADAMVVSLGWSPDGRHLVFQSNRRSIVDVWALELAAAKAVGEPFLVKRGIGEVTLRDWLPGGSLVYTASTQLRDVWIQPIDPTTGLLAGRPYPIGAVRGFNAQPAWSRDGTRVVYRAWRPVNDSPGLYITRLDDGTEHEIRLPPSVLNPTWSADGTIVYRADRTKTEPHRLVAVNPATGATRTFLDLDEFKDGFTPMLDFSPDGRELLFDVTVADPATSGLYIFDGGAVRKIPGTEEARPGRWTRDGAEIVFVRRGTNAFYSIRPDGTGLRRFCEVPDRFWVRYFALAPDGRHLVYCRSPLESPGWELWLAALDGTVHRRVDLDGDLRPMHVDWSPDGSNLALGVASDGAELWVLEGFWPVGK
jgi:Tol biopolymer transport system component